MRLSFFCDEKVIFNGEITEISGYSERGPFKIMDNHIPYMVRISNSVSIVKTDKLSITHNFKDGFLYSNGQECFVIVDTN
jgi:F0F1-type ATP synthase epsilon subunit